MPWSETAWTRYITSPHEIQRIGAPLASRRYCCMTERKASRGKRSAPSGGSAFVPSSVRRQRDEDARPRRQHRGEARQHGELDVEPIAQRHRGQHAGAELDQRHTQKHREIERGQRAADERRRIGRAHIGKLQHVVRGHAAESDRERRVEDSRAGADRQDRHQRRGREGRRHDGPPSPLGAGVEPAEDHRPHDHGERDPEHDIARLH